MEEKDTYFDDELAEVTALKDLHLFNVDKAKEAMRTFELPLSTGAESMKYRR